MADKETDTLTDAGALDGTERTAVVKGSNSRKTLLDSIAALFGSVADRILSVGIKSIFVDDGSIATGTYTPSPAGNNFRKKTNTGAHSFAPPSASNDYTMIVKYVNGSGAGAITTGAFTKADGDLFDTTVGSIFLCYIIKIDSTTYLNVKKVV